MTIIFILFILVFIGYGCIQVINVALPRFFLVPTHNWSDKIKDNIEYPKSIYLKVGIKRSSYRKRLVASSKNPSTYNNFTNNKLKIYPEDKKNEDNFFLENLKHRSVDDPRRKILYGFFHPYANNGGGGEKVLWQAVSATLLSNDKNITVIYTSNLEEPSKIIDKAESKFKVNFCDKKRIVFIYLRRFNRLIDNNYWKHFTLIGQLFGTALLTLEALFELSPDIWVDTIGLPGGYYFIYAILKAPIVAYVHYPILQDDMFGKLKFKDFSFDQLKTFRFTGSDIVQMFKLIYWSVLYYYYVYLGSLVDITLANGSWTFNHMKKIWFLNENLGSTLDILYPPCGDELLTIKNITTIRENKMIYIAQFRPEKRHELILLEYKKFLTEFNQAKITVKQLPVLVFLGSCRSDDDTETLNHLKQLVNELQLQDMVEFIIDCSYDEILHQLSIVKFGLNSMWNEHFGIGVVEYLANGVIPMVHASAGPLLDIATNVNGELSNTWHNDTGFFFKSEVDPDFIPNIQSESSDLLTFKHPTDNSKTIDYPSLSQLLKTCFIESPELISDSNLSQMRLNASKIVDKFSNQKFTTEWMKYTRNMESLEKKYRKDKRTSIENVF